jgi:hypothetical protein
MGKFKWILLCGALLIAFSANAVAGQGSESKIFFSGHTTSTHSAVLAAFVAVLPDGSDSSISVSNTMAVPSPASGGIVGTQEGGTFAGFPVGGGLSGPVTFYLFPNVGDPLVVSTADNPTLGNGTDEAGNLNAGGTLTVFASQVLDAAGGDETFVGYIYVVGEFDAIAGTYVNNFVQIQQQQAFPMQEDFDGTAITLVPADQ